ncbi:MAG TPA: RNA polymerase sigma factor [Clostridiales bacterium]|nr:RNA polymerase sigma factor [Clostridiales bacterium]
MAVELDELQLIEKAKAGDEVSFELLIAGCRTKAYNTALRFMQNEDDAMDALQESLIKVFRHLGNFKGNSRFDTWVYRIVVNSCKDLLRQAAPYKKMDPLVSDEDNGFSAIEPPDVSPGPAEVLENKETAGWIIDCLNRLPVEHKEIIILRDIQGFSYEEISQILELNLGTVKSRINRARLCLREIVLEQKRDESV